MSSYSQELRRKGVWHKVLALQTEHPLWTMADIAYEVGVSRERVRQIFKKNGLTSIFTRTHPLHRQAYPRNTCPTCGGPKSYNAKLCPTCSGVWQVELTCSECGKTFWRDELLQKKRDKRNPNHGQVAYCGNVCQGKAVGRRFGFTAHPENAGGRRKEFCLRGHPMSGDNLYVWKGQRSCRACAKIRRYKAYLRRAMS